MRSPEPLDLVLRNSLQRSGRVHHGDPEFSFDLVDRTVGGGEAPDVERISDQHKRDPGILQPACDPLELLPGVPREALVRLEEDRVTMSPSPLESRSMRRRVEEGESIEGQVPPAVAAYIEEHGLYRGSERR